LDPRFAPAANLRPNLNAAPQKVLFSVDYSHKGRVGDHAATFDSMALQFNHPNGNPLSSAQANALPRSQSSDANTQQVLSPGCGGADTATGLIQLPLPEEIFEDGFENL
jgi:hypothetical protein